MSDVDGAAPAMAPDGAPRVLHPAEMRRERRELGRLREVEIRDVGGLVLEMVRRDRFRGDLLLARCNDVLRLEERIHELDSMIAAAEVAARGVRAELCKCGAPIVQGAHFCSHCGRPAAETPPVVACAHCGQPLPAEANFCAFCGNSIAAEEFVEEEFVDAPLVPEEEPLDITMVAPSPPPEGRVGEP